MKYENGLNDLAGGKSLHKQPQKIRSDTAYEKKERNLVDDYKGKWCVEILMKDGRSAISTDRYDTKTIAEYNIKTAWKTGISANGKTLALPEEISLMIPMPAPKT